MDVLHLPTCDVDLTASEVRAPHGTAPLTSTEVKLLQYLAAHAGQLISREALLQEVWGYHPHTISRAVDHTVARLRKKLEPDPADAKSLITVFGQGYRLELRPPPSRNNGLIGRDGELAQVRRLLQQGARLITLCGPGGMGKTRLSRELIADPLPAFSGGALFLPLATCADGDDVLGVLAEHLGGLDHRLPVLLRALTNRPPTLLVLDNAEQLTAPLSALAERLLQTPHTLLVTSRIRLGLAEEQLVELAPLSEDDALALLIHNQGRLAAPDADPDACRALARAVGGLPLALVLAATRLKVLSPQQLLSRFERPLDALGGGERGLRATIQRSWELLASDEQALLAQLSVFTGAFPVEAAEAVLGADVLDGLTALREQSLLYSAQRGPDVTLVLYESVRAFAAEQLAPDRRAAVEARHCAWWLAWGEAQAARARLRGDPDARDALYHHRHELLAARARTPDPQVALRLIMALLPALRLREGGTRCLTLLDGVWPTVMRRPGAEQLAIYTERGQALLDLQRHAEAEELLRAGLAQVEPEGAPAEAGRALGILAMLRIFRGQDAEAMLTQAQHLSGVGGDPRSVALHIGHLGLYYARQGQRDAAEATLQEAITRLDRMGDRANLGRFRAILAQQYLDQQRLADARRLYEAALDAVRGQDLPAQAVILCNLGVALHAIGDTDAARAQFTTARELYRQLGQQRGECTCIVNLGLLALEQRHLDDARDRLEAGRTLADVASPSARLEIRIGLAMIEALTGYPATVRALYAELPPALAGWLDHVLDGAPPPGPPMDYLSRVLARLAAPPPTP